MFDSNPDPCQKEKATTAPSKKILLTNFFWPITSSAKQHKKLNKKNTIYIYLKKKYTQKH